VLYRLQQRPDRVLQATRLRRQTIEHVFGTFMASMESARFLTKTSPRVRKALGVLVCSVKRAIAIVDVAPLPQAMRAPWPNGLVAAELAAC